MLARLALSAAMFGAMTLPALAHPGHGSGVGPLLSGFAHPLAGLDHALVMIAVGLWAALRGGRAVWIVPAVFVSVMVYGFALTIAGLALPAVEVGMAGSVIAVGALIGAAVRPPSAVLIGLVGVFALFHGHAHGSELSGEALSFGSGFVAATALLHATGVGLGLILAGRGLMLARGVGGAIAASGLVLLGA